MVAADFAFFTAAARAGFFALFRLERAAGFDALRLVREGAMPFALAHPATNARGPREHEPMPRFAAGAGDAAPGEKEASMRSASTLGPAVAPRRNRTGWLRVLAALELLVAVGAVPAGLLFVVHPEAGRGWGPPTELLEGSPFADFLLPGLALMGLVGGSALLAAVFALRKSRHAEEWSLLAALTLGGFLAVEVLALRGVFALQLIFFAVALAIGTVALLPRSQLEPREWIVGGFRAHPLGGFFAVVFACTWLPHLLEWAAQTGHLHPLPGWARLFSGAVMLAGGPLGAAALAVALSEGEPGLRRWAGATWRWRVGFRWYLAAVLPYPLVAGVALLGSDLYMGRTWQGGRYLSERLAQLAGGLSEGTAPLALLLPALLVFGLLLVPLFEEPGWRGFALPRMQDGFGPLGAAVALGGVWAVWHLPGFFIRGSAYYGAPFGGFVVEGVALSIFLTWLYNATRGSVLICMLAHGSAVVTGFVLPAAAPAVTHDLFAYWLSTSIAAVAAFGLVVAVGTGLDRGAKPQPGGP